MVHFEKDKKGKPIVIIKLEGWLVKNEESVREIQVSPNAADVLIRRDRQKARGARYVFPAPKDPGKPLSRKHLNRMWHRMLKCAGLASSGFEFHWLRHTLYTRLLIEKGVPVAAVSAVGGTSMRTLSKHYLEGTASRTAIVGQSISHRFEEEE